MSGSCRVRGLGQTLTPLSNSLEPNFPTHSLQFHCIGLFEPKSLYILGLGLKLRPYNNNNNIYYYEE